MWEIHKSWFDERRLETELGRGLRHRSKPDNRNSPLPSATAPVVDSTKFGSGQPAHRPVPELRLSFKKLTRHDRRIHSAFRPLGSA